MKLFVSFLAIFIVLFSTSCHSSEKANQAKRNQEIIQAVRQAYSLEKQLYEHADQFTTREQVYQHYRTGFSKKLAESLTNYSWSGSEILNQEKSMESPDTVTVIHSGDSIAEVYYAIPLDLRTLWGLKKYAIDTLRKEDGRWKIYTSTNVSSIPGIRKN